ncbi:shikimate kinase [Pseudotabrizicola alkalilacus]|uniref:Shikimate kinase n=1 Tax=Pseudotabrizicola alkalilacus TaxID=2305252 RepID=A0A411Z3Q7_9RHOB|nr:shikimate kinase [Pseudotabrizicola alkalilacus]
MAFAASSRHEQKNARDAGETPLLQAKAALHSQGNEGGSVARLKKTVAMVGMMGAGKTAVGTVLARVLGVPFVDSDEEIVRAANRSIAEIFERDGEPFFRARESEVLARLLRGPPCVLSTGGGAYLADANRQLISDAGVAVWLRADLDLLWSRVRHKSNRPLLRTANPRETLRALYETRVPCYSQADVTVDASPDLSIEAMAERVIEALLARPDVLEGETT